MHKYWKKNRRQLQMTITHLNRFHNRSLRKTTKLSNVPLDNIFSKLSLVLWTSLAEVELNILITENEHFTRAFLDTVDLTKKIETHKWLALLDYYFQKHYLASQKTTLSKTNLGDTAHHRYHTIRDVILDDLGPFIELRNRVAHGQWAVAFNSDGLKKNQELTTHIWKLSKKDLIFLKSLVKNLPPLVKLLISSKTTFERDYDKYLNRINRARKEVDLRFDFLVKHLKRKAKGKKA